MAAPKKRASAASYSRLAWKLSLENTPQSNRKAIKLLKEGRRFHPLDDELLALQGHERMKVWRNRRPNSSGELDGGWQDCLAAFAGSADKWLVNWAVAIVARYKEKWSIAAARYTRARTLVDDPNSGATLEQRANVLADYGEYRIYLGDPTDGRDQALAAIAMVPNTPNNPPNHQPWYEWVLAFAHYQRRDYAAALAVFQQLENDGFLALPSMRDSYLVRAAAYARSGDAAGAAQAMEAFRGRQPNTGSEYWCWCRDDEEARGPFHPNAGTNQAHWIEGLERALLPRRRPLGCYS